MKLSSVHVRPDSQYSTGTRRARAAGGRNTPKRIAQPVSRDACVYTPCTPSKHRFSYAVSMPVRAMRGSPAGVST